MKNYLSVSEYCNKYCKDPGNVRRHLISGRLKGIKIGNQWVIDESEKYPEDCRVRNRKYVNWRNKVKLNSNKELAKALKEMSKEIALANKNKILKIVLYGSYARNEETEDSDIDVAVIGSKTINSNSLINISTKYELEINKVISIIEVDKEKYKKYKSVLPFYQSIEKEGINLWTKN